MNKYIFCLAVAVAATNVACLLLAFYVTQLSNKVDVLAAEVRLTKGAP